MRAPAARAHISIINTNVYLISMLVLKDGIIVDGTGNPWFKANITIEKDRIIDVGACQNLDINEEINVKGLVISPGFIDIHSHSDMTLVIDPRADSKLRQGVTTELIGHCGNSPAPLNDEMKEKLQDSISKTWGSDFVIGWETMGGYMELLESQGISVNIASLVGHGSVRKYVMGYEDRYATDNEIAQMKKLVVQAMNDGVVGMSAGLYYAPGIYSETKESIELCKVVKQYGGIYAIDHRDAGDRGGLLEAIAEVIEIGNKSGVSIEISHLQCISRLAWHLSIKVLKMLEDARAKGIDVTFDQYPYNAGATGLFALLPRWAKSGGMEELLERMKDHEYRDKVKEGLWDKIQLRGGPDNIIIPTYHRDPSLEGKSIEEIAQIRGKNSKEMAVDLLEESRIGIINFHMNWDDVIRIMKHPLMSVGSDGRSIAASGILHTGKPHPRYYGTYPRILGKYVREKKVLTLEEAIRRMTSAPALRIGLMDRGLIRKGFMADITVFDPDNVKGIATFEKPHQYSKGIEYVIINGELVVEHGEYNNKLAGRVFRKKGRLEYT